MINAILNAVKNPINLGQLSSGGIISEVSQDSAPLIASVVCFVLTEIVKNVKKRYLLKQIDKDINKLENVQDSSLIVQHLANLIKKQK